MFKLKKQLYILLSISGLNSFQLAGASWVILLSARGFSMIDIGLAEACFHIASFLFEIPSGVIADVFGRKRSMIFSQCMYILSALCMIFSNTIVDICFALMLDAFGFNFASGTREALAYDSLKYAGHKDSYIEFSSKDYSIYRLGNAFAILFSGFTLFIGYQLAYFTDVILGLLCLFLSFQLTEIKQEEKQLKNSITSRIFQCFKESFYFLTHHFHVLQIMFWNAFIGSVSLLTVYFLQAQLPQNGLSISLLGPALFLISTGGAIGAKLAPKFSHFHYWKLSMLCIIGTMIGFLCDLSAIPLFMCIGGFLLNMTNNILDVCTDAKLNNYFPSSKRATLISVSSLCFSTIMIILSPIMGYIFQR